MTPDLARLRASHEDLGPLFEALELELIDDPRWPEPSDTSYLTDKDRADADIMSNVEAMLATNQLIAWFGRDAEGFVGLWQGPTKTSIEKAPVARLDSEGQYSIVAATLADYLAISVSEEEFAGTRATLTRAGFHVAESREDIWTSLDAFENPNDYRHVLYNSRRGSRGLPPIDT